MNLVPSLDFQAIVDALPIDAAAASDALLRLSNLHIVELAGNLFIVSPPLRIAVERDKRVVMPENVRTEALKAVARTLTIRLDEGSARLDLVDTAVLSSIESGLPVGAIAAHFCCLLITFGLRRKTMIKSVTRSAYVSRRKA